jgi:hypothetical protein
MGLGGGTEDMNDIITRKIPQMKRTIPKMILMTAFVSTRALKKIKNKPLPQ